MTIGMQFARTHLAQFISSPTGRAFRIIVGLTIALLGYIQPNQTTAIALMLIGAIPFVAGVFNICLVSGLLGGPVSGERIATLRRERSA